MSTHTDERPNARASEKRLGFVRRPRFEDYREKYATYFNMERQNGILQVQMHTQGGPVMYGLPIHNAWSQLWLDLGNDPDNEVLPLDRLLPRAWEIAEKIMQKPRAIRRLTSAVLRRQWKRRLVEDLGFHIAHELLGMHLNK